MPPTNLSVSQNSQLKDNTKGEYQFLLPKVPNKSSVNYLISGTETNQIISELG